MANPWFRLYAEFANDAKVQMLSETNQRRLVMMFCFRCNGDVTLQDEEVAFQQRISNEEWLKTKAIFMEKGFINSANEVLNWDKRQYVSDSSTARVAKHREKVKQECNVSVTPPEQNRYRTEQNIKPTSRKKRALRYDDYPEFLEFWAAYPKHEKKKDALTAWVNANPPIEQVLNALAWQVTTERWTKNNFEYVPMPTTYINGKRWEDEPPQEISF